MKTRNDFEKRLNSWFGDTPNDVLHSWFEPTSDAPTLFATVYSKGELLFIRVYNTSGRLQVNVDNRIPFEDV